MREPGRTSCASQRHNVVVRSVSLPPLAVATRFYDLEGKVVKHRSSEYGVFLLGSPERDKLDINRISNVLYVEFRTK
jgi:hypothetical protein